MKYVIGIDLGTSGTKTVLFDQLGNTVASHTVEYPMHQPQNGWAEQDPADWFSVACIRDEYHSRIHCNWSSSGTLQIYE